MRVLWQLMRATANDWYDDRAQRLGAALAFYTVFALAPGLVVLIALTGLVLGPDAAKSQILEQVRYMIGATGASAIETTITSARQQAAGVTALAMLTLVFGLWGVFGELQDALTRSGV